MNLSRYLKEISISLDISAGIEIPEEMTRRAAAEIKEAVIGRLVELLGGTGKVANPSKLRHDMILREGKATTALGGGIAIPHVRTLQAKEFVMAVGLAPQGLPFDAPDGEPVRVFIAMMAPPHDDRTYLAVYQHLARTILDRGVDPFFEATSPGEIVRFLSD